MALVVAYFGYIARMSRAGVIYALASRLRPHRDDEGPLEGPGDAKHMLRNSLAPTITVISVQIGYLFGGIIGVEKVFNYHGLGSTIFNASTNHDIPVLQGAVLLVGIVYMVSTLAGRRSDRISQPPRFVSRAGA